VLVCFISSFSPCGSFAFTTSGLFRFSPTGFRFLAEHEQNKRSAHDNKQAAQDAYAAFGKGDAEGAMRNIDDSVKWTVRGDNALTGSYDGKQAVGELWAQFAKKDFRTEPHDYIADGDKVVVLTTIHLEGETVESADILTYNGGGKLVAFDTRADADVPNRVFAK